MRKKIIKQFQYCRYCGHKMAYKKDEFHQTCSSCDSCFLCGQYCSEKESVCNLVTAKSS